MAASKDLLESSPQTQCQAKSQKDSTDSDDFADLLVKMCSGWSSRTALGTSYGLLRLRYLRPLPLPEPPFCFFCQLLCSGWFLFTKYLESLLSRITC